MMELYLVQGQFYGGGNEAERLAKEGKCPKCQRPLRDLRGTGFNARAVEREGVCFWWADDAFTCVARRVG